MDVRNLKLLLQYCEKMASIDQNYQFTKNLINKKKLNEKFEETLTNKQNNLNMEVADTFEMPIAILI